MTEEQFGELVHANADAVRAFVYRRASGLDVGVSSVDDINSEVWAIAWQRRATAPAISEQSACRAWLLQIARFTIGNHIRKTVGHREVDRGLRPAEITAASAESIVVADLELNEALKSLKPAELEVFALTVWEGLSPKQIAIVTHSNANTVSIRLHRAKKKIAAALS